MLKRAIDFLCQPVSDWIYGACIYATFICIIVCALAYAIGR
jgi:hypothetical protein